MQRKFVSVVAIILVVLMILAVLVSALGAFGASAVSLSELEKQISETKSAMTNLEENQTYLAERKQTLQAELAALESDKNTYEAQKAILDEQMDIAEQEIENVNEQITQCETMISDKEAQLILAVEQEAYQFERYTERLRAMEEDGNWTYISILFSAKNFGDLLTKINDVTEIIEYDQMVAEELAAARVAVEEAKADLEETKLVLDGKMADLRAYEAELTEDINEIQAQIDVLVANIVDTEAQYEDAFEAEAAAADQIAALAATLSDLTAAQKEEIARLEAAAAAAAASGSKVTYTTNVAASGIFMWPSANSTTITSRYGMRSNPVSGVYKMHTGLDIGASYGTAVLAAASGVVAQAGWNGGYGNYILVNHGNGNMTAYAHMSQLNVSVGESVVQGQTIGLVGSTGNSTGPHLHFEIYVNGTRTDPANYFSF